MNPNPFIRDPQLGLFEARTTDANVIWLETFLRAHGTWITAARILTWHGRPDTESEKRIIRKLSAASREILGGQLGYKHGEHGTVEEFNHCINNLEAQARELQAKAIALRQYAHKRFS